MTKQSNSLTEEEKRRVHMNGWGGSGISPAILEHYLAAEELRLEHAVFQVDELSHAIHSDHFNTADLARLLLVLRKTLTEGIGV